MKMKCLIVEDEPIAQEILKSYIDKTDLFEISGQLNNAIDAFSFLQKNTIDLLFLDIKMPQMNGIELLKSLSRKPKVIITSAYRDFAIDAFDLDVVDYLLKPFSFERFLKAVSKTTTENTSPKPGRVQGAATLSEKSFFFVKGNKQLQKVYLDEILFIESQRDYLKFRMLDGLEIVTRQTIGYYEQFLPAQFFLRIHRSYIIAVDKIKAVEINRLLLGQQYLPIGRNYKNSVHEFLKTLHPKPDIS